MVSKAISSAEQRFAILARAIASAAIPVSILQGIFFALEGPLEAFNVAAVCLAATTLFFSYKYLKTSNFLISGIILNLFCLQFLFFAVNYSRTETLFHFRLLQVGITVSYLATAMVLLLVIVKILSLQNALLLSFSIAVVFFFIELTLNFLHTSKDKDNTLFAGPEWSGKMKPHPELVAHYAPYSVLKTYYPDNPRRYFRNKDAMESKWRLRVKNDNEANLVYSPYNPEKMKIDIKRANKIKPREIRLFTQPLSLKHYERYTLTYKARAYRPRNIGVSCYQSHKPWNNLGLYNKNIKLTSEWQSFNEKFIAKASDDTARIEFTFGNSDISVELSDITLRNVSNDELSNIPVELPEITLRNMSDGELSDISVELSDTTLRNMSDGKLVEPELSLIKRFLVSYKFNALGCRGRDYAIPGNSDRVRIVLLGNSFTLGVGVHEEDTFANQLERLLNKQAELSGSVESYEVINCGVSGYSTRENRLFYEMFASKYKPDIVLLVMAGENNLTCIDEINTPYSPPGKLESLSYIWSRMRKDKHDSSLPDESVSLQEILQLYDETQKHDARLAVLFFRNVSDSPVSVKSSFYKNWITFINRISDGLKDKEIPLLDLGYALFENHSEEDLFVHKVIDGHPNEVAHNIAARELEKFLDKEGWIKNNDKHLSLKD